MMRPFALALASTSGMSNGIALYCRMAPAVADSGVYGLLPFGTPFAAAGAPTSCLVRDQEAVMPCMGQWVMALQSS